ncbi:Rha family transcriptional regulator [Robertmurraya sp. DFI.2.37]|uniref:Rha family transcriptional regulator n=1 Tax=Robertmurraya sp. DFI.2.37 TaxID=3031819 RepID=UPI0012474539|nr:Rha family transcriptional regulator [Robertmurraya sp. DFI.2.37]MDF1509703.1 Rha family transcriptional regulator [Robertmurraya sp. DFI.2.37]
MSQLVFLVNNEPVTDSLTIADVFQKRHDSVIRDIENQIIKLYEAGEEEFSLHNFVESTYSNERGRKYRKFNLTEDAFTLVAMSYVTPEAMKMKVKFIQEFKRMREQLNQPKVLSEREQLIASMKMTIETSEKVEQIENKVISLEQKIDEQITLTSGEQRRLQKGIAQRVYEIESDQVLRSKLFRELHREIKDRFGVASYKDVKRKELQSALRYIENWVPRKTA